MVVAKMLVDSLVKLLSTRYRIWGSEEGTTVYSDVLARPFIEDPMLFVREMKVAIWSGVTESDGYSEDSIF